MLHNDQETTNNTHPEKKGNVFVEIVKLTLIALLIVIPVRYFIAQPFVVSGASMEPTFHDGQYLIIDQLSYRFDEPKRGDVIILKYPEDPSRYFIKRIIGLPFETVIIEGSNVIIRNKEHPEGFVLDESYARETPPDSLEEELGKNEYFVMGDNRPESSDSRKWGTLPRENIIGTPILRLLPVGDVAIRPGAER